MAKYSTKSARKAWANCFPTFGFQKDAFGRNILFDDYGKDTEYGWELDHIWPISENGANTFSNIQPLHHQSNEEKQANISGIVGPNKNLHFEVRKFYLIENKIVGRMYVNRETRYNYDRWQ